MLRAGPIGRNNVLFRINAIETCLAGDAFDEAVRHADALAAAPPGRIAIDRLPS